ncbi:MAG: glycosyltransferase [Myxococcales bacterium]|nr:glycosyltransferase [Myxococcales bacterium]
MPKELTETVKRRVAELGIVTVTRDDRCGLERTWRSIERQSRSVRWHVVDGASRDGSLEWLLELRQREPLLSFTSGPDDGPYDAMNRGWRALEATYLLFLNAGDELYDSTSLERAERTLATSDAPLVCCDVVLVDRQGRNSPGRPVERSLAALDRFNAIFHQGALIARTLLQGLGGYDTRYRFCADYDFFLRCRENGVEALFPTFPLARFVRDGLTHRRSLAWAYYREMAGVQRAHRLPVNRSLYLIGGAKALLGETLSDALRARISALFGGTRGATPLGRE